MNRSDVLREVGFFALAAWRTLRDLSALAVGIALMVFGFASMVDILQFQGGGARVLHAALAALADERTPSAVVMLAMLVFGLFYWRVKFGHDAGR